MLILNYINKMLHLIPKPHYDSCADLKKKRVVTDAQSIKRNQTE